MCTRSSAQRIALTTLVLCLYAPATAFPVQWTVTVILDWTTGPEPPCFYEFWGAHSTRIISYTESEKNKEVITRGYIYRYANFWSSNFQVGLVRHGNIQTDTHVRAFCPDEAQAKWRATTEGKIDNLIQVVPSQLVFGNCPDPLPEFAPPYQATKVVAVDLESGRVIQPDWYFKAPQGLTRTDVAGGRPFLQEEWVVIELQGDSPVEVLAASSAQGLEQVGEYVAVLKRTHGFRVGAPFLVIEAGRDSYNHVEPLIRLAGPINGVPVAGSLADGRVTLKARFSPHGELEDVHAIEGSEQAAWVLAKDLRVEFPLAHKDGGVGHNRGRRSVVFATFEVERGRVRFVSGVPTLEVASEDG